MTIKFESAQNTLNSSNINFNFMEEENLNYQVTITPHENRYSLTITSATKTEDPNRLFLYEDLFLEETTAPGNTMKFILFMNKDNIGSLHFEYYHDSDFKTFQICLFLNIFNNVQDVTFIFKRLKNFSIER